MDETLAPGPENYATLRRCAMPPSSSILHARCFHCCLSAAQVEERSRAEALKCVPIRLKG